MDRLIAFGTSWCLACLLVAGCTATPAPIVIHESPRTSIRLVFDPQAGNGHSHPVSFTTEQMAKVLRGVWVTKRDIVGMGLFAGDPEGTPAFSAAETNMLATYLAQALRKASPKDMATFYLTMADASSSKLVTSGGLFVRNGRMYFVLANFHTSPSSGQYETPYELDSRDDPLLPIARYKFTVGFSPSQARIPNPQVRGKDGYERYLDESKLLVIDLERLLEADTSPSPRPAP